MFQKTEVILFPNKERFATRSLLTGATLYKIPFWKWSESYSKPWQFFVLMQSSVPSRAVAFLWMHCCWRSQLSRCRTWHKHQCQLCHLWLDWWSSPFTGLNLISIFRLFFLSLLLVIWALICAVVLSLSPNQGKLMFILCMLSDNLFIYMFIQTYSKARWMK